MNVSTRHELQTLLDKIKTTQTSPEASPLAYRVAWISLLLSPLIAGLVIPLLHDSGWVFSVIVVLWLLLWFFVQALYTIIQHNVNKRLRPILEALLYVPEELPIQEEQNPKSVNKARNAHPTSRKRR
jgi:hypothetical protein